MNDNMMTMKDILICFACVVDLITVIGIVVWFIWACYSAQDIKIETIPVFVIVVEVFIKQNDDDSEEYTVKVVYDNTTYILTGKEVYDKCLDKQGTEVEATLVKKTDRKRDIKCKLKL